MAADISSIVCAIVGTEMSPSAAVSLSDGAFACLEEGADVGAADCILGDAVDGAVACLEEGAAGPDAASPECRGAMGSD